MKNPNKLMPAVWASFGLAILSLMFVYATELSKASDPNSFLASASASTQTTTNDKISGKCGKEVFTCDKGELSDRNPAHALFGGMTSNLWTCKGLNDGNNDFCSDHPIPMTCSGSLTGVSSPYSINWRVQNINPGYQFPSDGRKYEGKWQITKDDGTYGSRINGIPYSSMDRDYSVTYQNTGVKNATFQVEIANTDNVQDSASCSVNIPASSSGATGINLSAPANSSSSLNSGQTTQLTASTVDKNGVSTSATLTWTSSNPAVATVNSSGLVTAVGSGTTNITASSGSVSKTLTITVNAPTPAVVDAMPAPTIKAGSCGGNISLTWPMAVVANPNTGYYIYRSTTQNGTYSQIATVSTASYTDNPGQGKFYYKIAFFAKNPGGQSSISKQSSPVSTTASKQCKADIPTTPTVTTGACGGQINISWTPVANANTYNIFRSKTATGGYAQIAKGITASTTTYVDVSSAKNNLMVTKNVTTKVNGKNVITKVTNPGTFYYKISATNSVGTTVQSPAASATASGVCSTVSVVGSSNVAAASQAPFWKTFFSWFIK